MLFSDKVVRGKYVDDYLFLNGGLIKYYIK